VTLINFEFIHQLFYAPLGRIVKLNTRTSSVARHYVLKRFITFLVATKMCPSPIFCCCVISVDRSSLQLNCRVVGVYRLRVVSQLWSGQWHSSIIFSPGFL